MPRARTIDDDTVLDAALDAIGDVGPAGLTLAAVGERAGLSASTVVQRFGSKRGLLLAVAQRSAERTEAGATAASIDGPALDALVVWLTGLTARVASPEALANHLGYLQADLVDPELYELARRGARAMRRRIELLLERAVEAGELTGAEPGELAPAVEATYNGALIVWALHRDGALEDWMRARLERCLGPYRRGQSQRLAKRRGTNALSAR